MTSVRPASESTPRYLQPPPAAAALLHQRPTRRNTTGSNSRRASAAAAGSRALEDADLGAPVTASGEWESEIEMQAEQIRRERNAKRQKEAEEALTIGRPEHKDDKPLVGNLIGEGHVNYVLMYNMLTGIRIAVSYFFKSFFLVCICCVFAV